MEMIILKVVNNKITEITNSELFDYWLSREWDDLYSYPDFKERMKDCGVHIIEKAEQHSKQ